MNAELAQEKEPRPRDTVVFSPMPPPISTARPHASGWGTDLFIPLRNS